MINPHYIMSADITESVGFYEFLAWLEVNRKRLITAAVAIALTGFAISLFVHMKREKEKEASAALLKVGSALASGEKTSPPAPSDFLAIADKYSGTRAAERATILAADAMFNENRYNEAMAQFQKFQSQFSGSKLIPTAAIGIAACLESLDRLDEATKAYQDVAARYPNEPVAAQANYSLGRIFELKKQPAQALKSYNDASGRTARSMWAAMAGEMKESLLLKHPQLATNEVKAPAMAPVLEATNAANKSAATNVAAKPASASAPSNAAPAVTPISTNKLATIRNITTNPPVVATNPATKK